MVAGGRCDRAFRGWGNTYSVGRAGLAKLAAAIHGLGCCLAGTSSLDYVLLYAQLIEVAVCIGWNVVIGGILFTLTGLVGGNRVSAKVEIAGLDMPEMGALGYPEYIKAVLPEDISDEEV